MGTNLKRTVALLIVPAILLVLTGCASDGPAGSARAMHSGTNHVSSHNHHAQADSPRHEGMSEKELDALVKEYQRISREH